MLLLRGEQDKLKQKQILLSRFLLKLPFLQLCYDYIRAPFVLVSQMISTAALLYREREKQGLKTPSR